MIPPAAPTGSGAGKYVVPSQKKVLTPVAAKGKPEHHIKVLDSIAKNIPNLTRKNNLKNKQKKLTKKRPILQASKQPIEKTSLNLIGYADVGLLREQQHCAAGALGCKRSKFPFCKVRGLAGANETSSQRQERFGCERGSSDDSDEV